MGGRAMFGTGEQGHCGTCRWWASAADLLDARDPSGYGKCDAIRYAGSPGHLDVEPDEPAVTMDAEQYLAVLLTRAEFGCVLWEPAGEGGDG